MRNIAEQISLRVNECLDLLRHAVEVTAQSADLVISISDAVIDSGLQPSRCERGRGVTQSRHWFSDVARQQKTEHRAEQTNRQQAKIGMRADGLRNGHDQSGGLLERGNEL